jgi:hypothetical protein
MGTPVFWGLKLSVPPSEDLFISRGFVRSKVKRVAVKTFDAHWSAVKQIYILKLFKKNILTRSLLSGKGIYTSKDKEAQAPANPFHLSK